MTDLTRFRAFTKRVRISTTIALWVCVLCSIGLFVASFLVPPLGEIDPSVLKAGGEIFAFAALILLREAILEGFGVKLTHGQTTIELQDMDGKDDDKDEDYFAE